MEIINNNPFRQLGLLVGANAMQQDKHFKRIAMYLDAGDPIPQEYTQNTFQFLGKIERTKESIAIAASRLNQPSDKLEAALFWFYIGNEITDAPVFDLLSDVDFDEAFAIWSKLTEIPEITKKNASAYHNLSNIYLSGIMEGTQPNEYLYEKGISLKIKFLESDYIESFKAVATDSTYKTSKQELQLLFIKRVHAEIERNKKINLNKFLGILNKIEFSAKESFINDFVRKPIEQIERKIEENKIQRKADKSKSYQLGIGLFQQTYEIIPLIKSILGSTNIRYASIADKLADEILQCGIDYFKNFKDTNTYPGNASMDLFTKAKSLAVGSVQKQRCLENSENLQKWIIDKPQRDKQKRIEDDLKIITNKLEGFQTISDTVANARDLIDICKPKLMNIKNVLGINDDLYLQISSIIVKNAQGMLIRAVNKAQDGFKQYQVLGGSGIDESTKRFLNLVSIDELSRIVNGAYDVSTSMQSMDMIPDLKQSFLNNRQTLRSIKNQIDAAISTSNSSSSGCYIATMAYGSYDHPQVLVLRQFRDEVLDKSTLGKWFIKTYYHYSPMFVQKLKNHKKTNILIRKLLNQIIKLIKL